jgi:hypothetical protein
MYVCLFVCLFVMYVCMYVCMCVCMFMLWACHVQAGLKQLHWDVMLWMGTPYQCGASFLNMSFWWMIFGLPQHVPVAMRGNQDLGSCDVDPKTCPGMAGMSSCWSSNSPLPKHTISRGCNRNQFFFVARPLLFRTPSTPALGSLEPQGFCGQVKSWVSNAFHPVPKKQMMIPILW